MVTETLDVRGQKRSERELNRDIVCNVGMLFEGLGKGSLLDEFLFRLSFSEVK